MNSPDELCAFIENNHNVRYEGCIDDGSNYTTFYINTNTFQFYCKANIEGSDYKIVGKLTKLDDEKYSCVPIYEVIPQESTEWQSAENESIKVVDLRQHEMEFEGSIIYKCEI